MMFKHCAEANEHSRQPNEKKPRFWCIDVHCVGCENGRTIGFIRNTEVCYIYEPANIQQIVGIW